MKTGFRLLMYEVYATLSFQDTSVLSPAIPIGIVLACAFYVYKHSASNLFETSPCLVDIMYGITIAKLTCKLVVSSFHLPFAFPFFTIELFKNSFSVSHMLSSQA